MSLTIENNKIVFINTGRGGRAGIQNSFTLARNMVAIVGLKFSIFLDDNEYFIVFVDYNGRCYLVNSIHIDTVNFLRIQNIFQIEFALSTYGEDYYENEKSIIKYPLNFSGKPLFKNNKTFFENIGLFWKKLSGNENPVWDYLSESSIQLLKENSL
jgi:hypothetical protein